VNWKLPGNWTLPDWRSLDRRHWYAISGVAVPIVIVAGLLVLWAAGAFGGGGDAFAQTDALSLPIAERDTLLHPATRGDVCSDGAADATADSTSHTAACACPADPRPRAVPQLRRL
jgi:hypothetical protein